MNMECDKEIHRPVEAASLENLNDDCLLLIMDCLPQEDVLALTLVSKRLHQMAHRSLQSTFSRKRVEISKFPSSIVRRCGPWIRYLNVMPMADEKMVDALCKLCPNLISLSFGDLLMEAFSKPHFRQTLSQLEELKIEQLLTLRNVQTVRKSIESALGGCENLTKLSLGGRWSTMDANFEPFYTMKLPKIRALEILSFDLTTIDSLKNFLERNATLTSFTMANVYGIADAWLRPPNISSIIPNIAQKQLQELHICVHLQRDAGFIKSLFAPNNHLSLLTALHFHSNSTYYLSELDFSDENLLQMKNLPNLTVFEFIHSGHTMITLPGILKAIERCPKLVWFFISGFRQPVLSATMVADSTDPHSKFLQIYREEIRALGGREIIDPRIYQNRLGDIVWYHLPYYKRNHIHLYKKIME